MTAMSEGFTTEGFQPFPNTYADLQHLGEITEWDEARLRNKLEEYWGFIGRDDIMPRAREAAQRILEHLGFEVDMRFLEAEGVALESTDGK
jgi:hypothetical protein